MAIVWRPRLWKETAKVAGASEIGAAESALGVKFPADYREFIRTHQGMSPDPNVFSFVEHGRRTETTLGILLHFSAENADRVDAMYYLPRAVENMSEWLPRGVVPFATDDGGNAIAFDYRISAERPPVVFIDHGEAFVAKDGGAAPFAGCRVADTFTDFLELLHPLQK